MSDGFYAKALPGDYGRWKVSADRILQLQDLIVFQINLKYFIVLNTKCCTFRCALSGDKLFDIISLYDNVHCSGDYNKFIFHMSEIL